MDFYQRVAHYLKSEFAEKTGEYDVTSLQKTIEDQVTLAQLYKFTNEAEVVRFVDLCWRIGPDFDKDPAYPWAREILSHIRLSPADKIKMLRDAYAMDRAHTLAGAL